MSNVPSAATIETDQPLLVRLSTLQRVSTALNRIGAGDDGSVNAALRLIVDGVVKLVPGTSALIVLYDEALGGFDPASHVSSDGLVIPLSGYPRASICFPLRAAGRPVGALYLCLSDQRAFSRSEMLMLEILVSHAAMALYRTRRLEGVRCAPLHSATELRRPWSAAMPAPSEDLPCDWPLEAQAVLTAGAGREVRAARVRTFLTGARCDEPGCVTMLTASGPAVLPAVEEPFAGERCHEDCGRRVGGAPNLEVECSELDVLTGREREVLALLAEGMTNKQIAAVLVITPNTVKRHLKAIFEKLGIRTRSAAAAKAISARFPAF